MRFTAGANVRNGVARRAGDDRRRPLRNGGVRRLSLVVLALAAAALGACASRAVVPNPSGSCATAAQLLPAGSTPLLRNSETLPAAPFAVSLVPTVPVPIRIGTRLGFQLSSGTAGYTSLYVIDPVHDVQVLAENQPTPAGSLEYPSSQGFTLRAAEPVGFNRAILLVTRQPFSGFSGAETLNTPVSTALDGRTFVRQLNGATRALPPSSWAADEVCLRVVG